MTHPTDLQEEIERLAGQIYENAPREKDMEEESWWQRYYKEALRELAAWCYRDAQRVVAQHYWPRDEKIQSPDSHQAELALAIARRAKEVT